MFCMECGAEVSPDATFCAKCGASQPVSVATALPLVYPIQYRVVLKGIKSGLDQNEAKDKLATLFKTSREKIDELLSSSQFVVKKGLPFEAAVKYQTAIDAAGGNCVVEPELEPATETPEAPFAPIIQPMKQPMPPTGTTAGSLPFPHSSPTTTIGNGSNVVKPKSSMSWKGLLQSVGLVAIVFGVAAVYGLLTKTDKTTENAIRTIVPTGEWACQHQAKDGSSSKAFQINADPNLTAITPTGPIVNQYGYKFDIGKKDEDTPFYYTFGVLGVSGDVITFYWRTTWQDPNSESGKSSIDLYQGMNAMRIGGGQGPIDPRVLDNVARGISVSEKNGPVDEITVKEISQTKFSGLHKSYYVKDQKADHVRDEGLIQCDKIVAVATQNTTSAAGPLNTPPQNIAEAPSSLLLIKIGHIAPLTGGAADLGKDAENGVRLAIDEANTAKFTIEGKESRFELISEDDQTNQRVGIAAALQLIDKKVVGLVGPLFSGVAIPVSALANTENIPMISGASTNPKLTEQGFKNVFRVLGRGDQQGPAIASYLLNTLKPKVAVVIDDSTGYGESMAKDVDKALKAYGVSIISRQKVTDKDKDFTDILSRAKRMDPDAIFYGGMDSTGGLLLKQARNLGIRAVFVFGDGACTDRMHELAGEAAEGLLCSQVGIPAQSANRKFLDAFREKFKADPILYAPFTYDATNALILAIKKANSANPAKYLPELAKISYTGATGKIEFDEKGDRKNAEVTIFTMKGGKIVPIAVVKSGKALSLEAFASEAQGVLERGMNAKSIENIQGAAAALPSVSPTSRPTEQAAAPVKSRDVAATGPDLTRTPEMLESYPLGALKMVDTSKQKGVTYASVQVGTNVYQVKVGNYLGQDYGHITEITENRIILKELVRDSSGNWKERKTEMVRQD